MAWRDKVNNVKTKAVNAGKNAVNAGKNAVNAGKNAVNAGKNAINKRLFNRNNTTGLTIVQRSATAEWQEEKKTFNDQKQIIDSQTTPSAIRQMAENINANIKQYVNTAGISTDPNSNQYYYGANYHFGILLQREKEYQELNNSLTAKVKELSAAADISSNLQQLGSVRNDIAKLEKELQAVKQDAETSRTREKTVKNPRIDLSWYQGFASKVGFTKPLHQISVPILMGFGILLLFLTGLLLKDFFNSPTTDYVAPSESLFSLFTDSRFYAVLSGITLVSIVLGILAYKGYLGKTI
jgi:hypothetical protein